ncbi:MAG TPA: polyphosphate kinase 2 family protein [Pyrinomonadaceae bacterium]|nr:polyphosphate kinase 2 family protein [Pyrinomonadaceae bacterium]
MTDKNFLKLAKKYSEPFRITEGKKFSLTQIDPDETLDLGSGEKAKAKAKKALESGVELLTKLQDKLYAHDRWAVLLIFQAMDAAGKDGAIKHVMSGVNPQGCEVTSFKSPSAEELDHDYLWRCAKRLPERGRIGIFNRSYYEETLVVRVHPEYLKAQQLPETKKPDDIWKQRFNDINNFESYITNNGIVILKFFLHVSKEEQEKRFLARIDDPAKNWKFSMKDVKEREHWDDYMHAYEQTVRHTATDYAPWYVVPADTKWFTRLVVASAIVQRLSALDLTYPKLSADELSELKAARQALIDTANQSTE